MQNRKKAGLSTHLKNMSETTLRSIPIEMGTPFVYRDLRMCDHLVFFKDIVKDEELALVPRDKFPLPIFFPRVTRRLCQVCEYHFARMIVKKDKLSPYSVNFYCVECFRDLHLE